MCQEKLKSGLYIQNIAYSALICEICGKIFSPADRANFRRGNLQYS